METLWSAEFIRQYTKCIQTL